MALLPPPLHASQDMYAANISENTALVALREVVRVIANWGSTFMLSGPKAVRAICSLPPHPPLLPGHASPSKWLAPNRFPQGARSWLLTVTVP